MKASGDEQDRALIQLIKKIGASQKTLTAELEMALSGRRKLPELKTRPIDLKPLALNLLEALVRVPAKALTSPAQLTTYVRHTLQNYTRSFTFPAMLHVSRVMRQVIEPHLDHWFKGPAHHRAFAAGNAFWTECVMEIVQAYHQVMEKVIREKNMESSVLFHTTESVSTQLNLDDLLNAVLFHASMLLRNKQIFLFLANPKPKHRPEDQRLSLRAGNRLNQPAGDYSLLFGEGPVGKVAKTQEALIDNAFAKTNYPLPFLGEVHSILVVPIIFSHETLGVLLAADPQRGARFHTADKDLFTLYAKQIAGAFQNVLLYQEQLRIASELEEKNQMLEAQTDLVLRKSAQMVILNEISQKVNSSLDFQEVLALLSRQAAECIGVDRCVVWLFDEHKVCLNAVSGYGLEPQLLPKMALQLADIDGTSFFRSLTSLKPVQLKAGEDRVLFEERLQNLLVVNALLAVPLIHKEQAIGLLVIDDTREQHEFLDDEITLISAIANQTVMAIENAQLYQKVMEQAITDGLTEVYNHRFFQLRFANEYSHAKRYNTDLALIILDIDHFKHYNDTYGHVAGDLVLKEIAAVTKNTVREHDIVARYGGEEFTIILPMTNLEGARVVAERLRQTVEECKFLGDVNHPQVTVTISIGLSSFSDRNYRREDLIQHADSALYAAKESGRNKVVAFEPGVIELKQ